MQLQKAHTKLTHTLFQNSLEVLVSEVLLPQREAVVVLVALDGFVVGQHLSERQGRLLYAVSVLLALSLVLCCRLK